MLRPESNTGTVTQRLRLRKVKNLGGSRAITVYRATSPGDIAAEKASGFVRLSVCERTYTIEPY